MCVSVSKRLTAGCEEGQSQSGSYSKAHCPLATAASLLLSHELAASLPLAAIPTLSTHSLSPTRFFFTFHCFLAVMRLGTTHENRLAHTAIIFTHLVTKFHYMMASTSNSGCFNYLFDKDKDKCLNRDDCLIDQFYLNERVHLICCKYTRFSKILISIQSPIETNNTKYKHS